MAQDTIVGPHCLHVLKAFFLNDAVIFKHNVNLQRQKNNWNYVMEKFSICLSE